MSHHISDSERNSGVLSSDTLAAIVRDINAVGYAVVEQVISQETSDLLSEAVLEDVERIRATGQPTQHERNTAEGHLQLGLRRYAPYVKTELVANPLIECVVARVLGRGAWLGFYNGNVNCPGSAYQPLHFDRPFSWKTPDDARRDGQPWPPPGTTLSCSISLDEITEANGATEIYPGTHRETAVAGWSTNRLGDHRELIEKWSPSARMTIPARSVCFRDPRMWHRGVPNTANRARAMIAATYHAENSKHWRGVYIQDLDPDLAARCAADQTLRLMDDGTLGDGRLVFQSDVREVFEGARNLHGIDRNVRFIDDPERVNHFFGAHLPGGARVVTGEVSPDGP